MLRTCRMRGSGGEAGTCSRLNGGVSFDETRREGSHDVRCIAHALHATRCDDGLVARLDALGGEHHRLHAARADLVNGDCVRPRAHPRTKRDLARGRLADTGLDDVSEEDFLDGVRVHLGLLDCVLEGDDAELRGGERLQGSIERADRGARGRDNNNFVARLQGEKERGQQDCHRDARGGQTMWRTKEARRREAEREAEGEEEEAKRAASMFGRICRFYMYAELASGMCRPIALSDHTRQSYHSQNAQGVTACPSPSAGLVRM